MEERRPEDESKPLQPESEARPRRNRKKASFDMILRPAKWVRKLSQELHWSLVLGVVIVYGFNQGLGVGLARVSTQYYLKDEQKVQPSEAQVYVGIIQIPWIVKPLWGLLTDVVPVLGYRRRPYFIFAGFLGVASMLVLSLHTHLPLVFALLYLITGSTGMAMADVTIDACVTQCSISHPSLVSDLQSFCGMCSSIGALVGFSLSGFLVHLVGPKGVYGLMSLPAGLVVSVGMILREAPSHSFAYRQVNEKFLDAGKAMWRTIQYPDVWKPCLYMFLSLALSLHIHEGMFYWYTDAKDGPAFSQEAVGSIFSVGAIGGLIGVLLYQNLLKEYPFRNMIFWAQSLLAISGLLDLVLVLRINLKLGMPDYFFVVIDEAVYRMIGRLKWMPLLVLSSKLCPAGIEGTFFALLMSIDHIGLLVSSWGGGVLLHMLDVTRTQFDNLWLVIVLRSISRTIPIFLISLIPAKDPNLAILPDEMLKNKRTEVDLESENIEMISLINED